MPTSLQLHLSPEEANDLAKITSAAAQQLRVASSEIKHVALQRRSLDARRGRIKYVLKLEVYFQDETIERPTRTIEYPNVSNSNPIVVVGAGPAGLFAALRLIELGLKPIVVERGKDVRERRRDLAAINKEHIVNPDSNYCFGEGGAGTYSDGKLYTRSTKRGSVERILNILVNHGAKEEILIDAHPHIGTNKLPKIIVAMRETIRNCGGQVLFNTRVEDFILQQQQLKGIITHTGDRIEGKAVILATGHSARDIFELLHRKDILIEAKTFALGVRAEHHQGLIDEIQYKRRNRGEHLPPASYSLVQQVQGAGVYSFCMCPGGIIAPCATSPGEVVTNGWSPSKRNNPFANAGIVVEVKPESLKQYQQHGPLSGLRFQQEVEQNCWVAGGKTQAVPAQRMMDFVRGKASNSLPASSYQPGTVTQNLSDVLPRFVATRLQGAFKAFGEKMKGYATNEAVLHATESRTSSPIRIPRDKQTLQHPQIQGLYPCGEGAGYAGGIISAAIDGERCADQIGLLLSK